MIAFIIRPGCRIRAPHTIGWVVEVPPITVVSLGGMPSNFAISSYEGHRLGKSDMFRCFRGCGTSSVGKIGTLAASRRLCGSVGCVTFEILVWTFMLVDGRLTYEGGQEIIIVSRLPGRGFLNNRGSTWKIDVLDLRDNISVRDGNPARDG